MILQMKDSALEVLAKWNTKTLTFKPVCGDMWFVENCAWALLNQHAL